MTAVTHPTRVFVFGALELDDPSPTLSPDEVRLAYADVYPALATSAVGEPTLTDGVLRYPLSAPVARTKG